MRQRRETVEHPFGTIKSWMGYTHFQMKTLRHVGTEMALHVLAYNLKRVINIIGIAPLAQQCGHKRLSLRRFADTSEEPTAHTAKSRP